MQEIRWGIIGCGDVTEIKSGPAFNKVNNSRLVAVMRRDAAKAQDYAARHSVPKWYSDGQDLIDDAEVNAIYVATPPLHHEEYTIKALNTGKPVYVEKPMSLSADGAERMRRVSEETGVKLTVAHYRRQIPLFKKIRELVTSGAIGDVRLVNLQLLQPDNSSVVAQTAIPWRVNPSVSGGGLFHDLSPHQLDLMIYFFGEVEQAIGVSINQAGFYNADDIVSGWIRFKNKVIFNGVWSFAVPREETKDHCEIIGSGGKLSFSIFTIDKLLMTRNGQEELFPFEPLQHVQQPMIETVVQYFLDEAPNPCPAEEGVEVMRLIDAFTGKD